MSNENLAVVAHLIRMIQDSPDVRYYVGGPHTRMRELLVAAIKANGYQGDPLEVLEPAPHHAHERPRVQTLAEELERFVDEPRCNSCNGPMTCRACSWGA